MAVKKKIRTLVISFTLGLATLLRGDKPKSLDGVSPPAIMQPEFVSAGLSEEEKRHYTQLFDNLNVAIDNATDDVVRYKSRLSIMQTALMLKKDVNVQLWLEMEDGITPSHAKIALNGGNLDELPELKGLIAAAQAIYRQDNTMLMQGKPQERINYAAMASRMLSRYQAKTGEKLNEEDIAALSAMIQGLSGQVMARVLAMDKSTIALDQQLVRKQFTDSLEKYKQYIFWDSDIFSLDYPPPADPYQNDCRIVFCRAGDDDAFVARMAQNDKPMTKEERERLFALVVSDYFAVPDENFMRDQLARNDLMPTQRKIAETVQKFGRSRAIAHNALVQDVTFQQQMENIPYYRQNFMLNVRIEETDRSIAATKPSGWKSLLQTKHDIAGRNR